MHLSALTQLLFLPIAFDHSPTFACRNELVPRFPQPYHTMQLQHLFYRFWELGVRSEEASTAQTNVGGFVFENQSSHLGGSDSLFFFRSR